MQKVFYSLVLLSFILVGCGSDEAAEVITDLIDTDAPVLGSIGDQTVMTGGTLTFTVSASDANGDDLTFSATATGTDPRNLNPPATYSTNQNQVSADFSWAPGAGHVGDYVMQFTVTDNSLAMLSDSETITISVVDPLDTIASGRILYRDNCGDCHGFEGLAGSEGIIGAPTAANMEEAFPISSDPTMRNFAGFFTLDERQSMYEYLCTLPENNLC